MLGLSTARNTNPIYNGTLYNTMSAKAKLQKKRNYRCCVIYREFNIRSKSAIQIITV
jgi:hypothetical protein